MQFFLGVIEGVLLTVIAAFVADFLRQQRMNHLESLPTP